MAIMWGKVKSDTISFTRLELSVLRPVVSAQMCSGCYCQKISDFTMQFILKRFTDVECSLEMMFFWVCFFCLFFNFWKTFSLEEVFFMQIFV